MFQLRRRDEMINKEYGKFTIVCDVCEEILVKTFDTLDEAVKAKRTLHYISRKEKEEWLDICYDCQEPW